jgi:signal transduction histidine kinase
MTVFALASLLVAALFGVLWLRARKQLENMEVETTKKLEEDEAYVRSTTSHAEMLHRLVDGIDDGLMIVSADMRVVFVNKGSQRFFPPIIEAEGRPLLEYVRDHRMVELISSSAMSGQRTREEFLVSSPGMSSSVEDHVYSVEAVPLTGDALKEMAGAILVILRNETEKHTLEKIRKDFVANASHELRTPLSIITGYLENLMEGDIAEPAQTKRAFTIMKKHGDRLANIVEDLLVISRMESGQLDVIKQEEFDFKACAQDVVQRLSPVIASKEARVAVALDADTNTFIYGDQFYWDQILFNLVGNALKENQAKGLEVIIRLKQENEFSEITVRDNGVGIPHADLPFVFKRFYRVARHHSQEIKGTGLGLSIVKRAVEAHSGTITVHSKPGLETVFTIRVPRYSEGMQPPAKKPLMLLL